MRGPKLSPALLEDIRRTERLNRDEIVRAELKRSEEAEALAESRRGVGINSPEITVFGQEAPVRRAPRPGNGEAETLAHEPGA